MSTPEQQDPDYDDTLPTPEEEDHADNAAEAESPLHEQLAGQAADGAIDEHGNPVHGEDDGSEGIDVDESDEPDAEETGPGPIGDDEEGSGA